MPKENDKNSAEELVIKYLKKNKNFFIKFPELIKELNFPLIDNGSDKVIDLEAYRYKKISQANIDLQNQMTQILLAGKSLLSTQKRILRSSLKILNSKSMSKIIDVIINDFKIFLACDVVNCFTTDNDFKIKNVHLVDKKIANTYFKDKFNTYLSQNPKGILLYFPNKSKIIKSYILLKVNVGNDYLIIAMGSREKNKFSPDLKVDLMEYLIGIIEIKLSNI